VKKKLKYLIPLACVLIFPVLWKVVTESLSWLPGDDIVHSFFAIIVIFVLGGIGSAIAVGIE